MPWFLCAVCTRRCAILYRSGCRKCAGLHYAGEHEGRLDRMYRKAFKIRDRLGQASGGLVAPFPEKPKRMRWHTYLRIRKDALELEQRILAAIALPFRY